MIRVCLIALSLSLTACAPSEVYTCGDDSQCFTNGTQGACESSGFCSFPDERCTSGRSYGDLAEESLAGQCTNGSAAATAWR